ncbi:kvs-4, partial [Pristionchus pacificus]
FVDDLCQSLRVLSTERPEEGGTKRVVFCLRRERLFPSEGSDGRVSLSKRRREEKRHHLTILIHFVSATDSSSQPPPSPLLQNSSHSLLLSRLSHVIPFPMSHQAARLGAQPNRRAERQPSPRDDTFSRWDSPRFRLSEELQKRRIMISHAATHKRHDENANGSLLSFGTPRQIRSTRKKAIDKHEEEESEHLTERPPTVPPIPLRTLPSCPGATKGITVENARSHEFLRVNVGGHRFMLRKDTIILRDQGRLSWILIAASQEDRLQMCDAYFESTCEYYFERPPALFHIVYSFYLTGQIHQPSHLCPTDILDEFDYWGIVPDTHLAACCCIENHVDDISMSSASSIEIENEFKDLFASEIRRKVWNVIEEPTSSCSAQVFAFLSVMFVLISISGLVLGSLHDLQLPMIKNVTAANGSIIELTEMEPHPLLTQIEYVCIVWFSIEYTSKMIVSPARKKTFFQLLNIIDLMAIVPFFIEISLMIFGIDTESLRDLKGAFLVIRILRVLRVIRVLKLGRYSSGLQMFGKTLKASFRQLGMMAMVVLTGVIFFSTLVYFLEKDEPGTQFHSIPAACWWCIVTMTTVGYGDLTPTTVPGKLVATGAIACGVLVLALPITIIVDNFMKVAEGEREGGVARRFGRRPSVAYNPRPLQSVTQDTIC